MMNEKIHILEKCISLLDIIILLKILKRKRRKIRRWWVKPILSVPMRDRFGAFTILFKYFAITDEQEFINFSRMNLEQFIILFDLLEDKLIKRSRRLPLPASLRLAITLHLLGHGSDVASTAWHFCISKSVLYRIILEVCTVIYEVAGPLYIQFPDKKKWKEIANGFWKRWQFPNCIGALDGKHIQIQLPQKSGSLFFNYKKFNSIVLLAACNSNCLFTWFNIGDYGSCSDSSILTYTDLYSKMMNNQMDIPTAQALPHTNIKLPLAFVADEIFPLKNQLLKPYTQSVNMTVEEKIFNYRLKRARMAIECSFGILSSRWRILRQCLKFDFKKTRMIVSATIILHNFILSTNSENNHGETISENVDVEDVLEGRMSPWDQRNYLKQYFNSPVGSVPWQEQCI